MTLNVIQWATGGIGKAAIQGITKHPDLRLVGCWVHSDNKVGIDAGILADIGQIGVKATSSVDDILALDADCVVYAPVYPNEKEVRKILASGKSVITPTGWYYPFKTLNTEKLSSACQEGNASLLGTGIHPGGFTERFPLQLASMQSATTYVRSEEFSDIRTYGAPEVVGEMMMFGKTLEEVQQSPMADYLATGFYQSIHMIADEMKMRIDSLNTVHEIALATAPIDSPIGTIEPGRVAAQRFVWQAITDGQPTIEAIVNWYMGEENFDKPWTFGDEGCRYEIEVKGDPDLSAIFHGTHPHSIAEGLKRNEGIVVTALHCVNSIPYLCKAEPGIHSYLDLPMISGRAAPEISR